MTSLIKRCPPCRCWNPAKFTEFLPGILRSLLPPASQEYTAVSKYVLCCDKTAYQHGFGYWQETGASPYDTPL